MISQNSIQIINAIQLSIPYLNRFFSKAGPIQQIQKDLDKKIVYIEFKSKQNVQKALAFAGRVLDKKPIVIRRLTQKLLHKQEKKEKIYDNDEEEEDKHYDETNRNLQRQNNREKNKRIIIEQSMPIKLPGLHEFNKKTDLKLKAPVRSEYRLIQHSELSENEIHFQNNPLEAIKNKTDLWKVIINQMSLHISDPEMATKELVMSISMGIWALIQLKLQQIQHLLKNKENQKSKYIENFIQDLVLNKVNILKNPKIINSSGKYKAQFKDQNIEFSFCVFYPEQLEQQEKFYCQANEKVYKILCVLYQLSPFLGKVYHELHTNSLILYEKQEELGKIVDKFIDRLPKPLKTESMQAQMEIKQISEAQNQIRQQGGTDGLLKEGIIQKAEDSMTFNGFIENYGYFLFQHLIPYEMQNHYNSMIWLETKLNRLLPEGPSSYPGFFHCHLLFNGCKQRTLSQSSFFNLYQVNEQGLQRKQSHTFQQYVIVFEDGQFSLSDVIENTIGFLRFELRKMYFAQMKMKEDEKEKVEGMAKKKSDDEQIFNVMSFQNHSQNDSKSNQENDKVHQHQKTFCIDIDTFYMGVNMQAQHQLILTHFRLLQTSLKTFVNDFASTYAIPVPQIKITLSLIEMIPQKQAEFNAFKCENYLINHIDKQILARNSIIASEEFAEKVAEKVLEEANGNQLFGFKDKKYIGSEIWRLYNKSGARRAKLKISQFHIHNKRQKSE